MPKVSLQEFASTLNEIMPFIVHEFMRRHPKDIYKVKVTMPQSILLEHLNRAGELKMSDLAKHLNVSTAAMSGIIERLVRDRYVTRLADPQDRRVIRIILTRTGKKAVDEITERRIEGIKNLFGMLSQGERDDYLRILTRISDALKARAEKEKK